MNFDEIITIVITSVVLPLLAWGIKKFTSYLDSKIDLVKNENAHRLLNSALGEMERAVELSVAEIGSTFVDGLKKEGKFTKEEAIKASEMAIEKTKGIMTNAGIEIIKDAKIDFETYIKALIEENLIYNKE